MTTTDAVRYEVADGIVTLTMDDPDQSANTMNETYRNAMEAAVDRLVKDIADNPDSIKGVIVASAKKTFFAGGDLKGSEYDWRIVSLGPEQSRIFYGGVTRNFSSMATRLEDDQQTITVGVNVVGVLAAAHPNIRAASAQCARPRT